MIDMDMILDYFKDRKELLYFLGGYGLGMLFGAKFLLLGILVYIAFKWLEKQKTPKAPE